MNKQLGLEEFLDSHPESVILDVRTPAEYASGHIKGAINFPLFTDQERAEVGTLYVKNSREAAIERGLEIVGPRMADMVREGRKLSEAGQKLLKIYCWRGGMRSSSVQWLLETAGIKTVRLKGGYKTYRSDFDRIIELPWHFKTLSGNTGSGKTEILQQLECRGYQILDLEELANHKGSAFGALGQLTQPTTEEFINLIHQKLRSFDDSKTVWVEGESITIGHVFIPQKLFDKLSTAPIVQIIIPAAVRLERIMAEYGCFSHEQLITSLEKIKKRLGWDNYKFAVDAILANDVATAATIALKYYDKCYTNSQLKRDPTSIINIESSSGDAIINTNLILEKCKKE